MKSTPDRNNQSFSMDADPIDMLEIPRAVKTGGRPKKLKPMPLLTGMTPVENQLFNDFIYEYLDEYPDITPTDYRILFLVAVEYVKYLRVASEELTTGKVMSMARQHPGPRMQTLMDGLAITRKQRLHTKPHEDEDKTELRSILMGVSAKR